MKLLGKILCFLDIHKWIPDKDKQEQNALFKTFVPYLECKRCGIKGYMDYFSCIIEKLEGTHEDLRD